jgi:hypothetical protein
MRIGDTWISVNAETAQFVKQVDAAMGEAGAKGGKTFNGKMQGVFAQIKGGILSGIGLGAGISAFSALGNVMGEVVGVATDLAKAGMEEEAGQAKLNTALRNNVPAWDGSTAAIEAAIDAGVKMAFTDDALKDSIAQLVTRTHDIGKAIQLQALAMDLARAKGVDLTTATQVIGKVYDGQVGTLTRYGIAVTKGATSTEALAQVQRAVMGQAQTYADTTAGGMESLSTTVDKATGELGEKLLPTLNNVVQGALNLVDGVGKLGTELNNMNRFLSPATANADDLNAALDQAGVALGLSSHEMAEYAKVVNYSQPNIKGFADGLTATILVAKDDQREMKSLAAANLRYAQTTGAAATIAEQAVGPWQSLGSAFRGLVTQIATGGPAIHKDVLSVAAQFRTAGPSIQQSLTDATTEAASGMAALRWAIANPNAWKLTRATLSHQMAVAQAALATAIKQGKPEVVAQARLTIAGIQAQLDKLPPAASSVGQQVQSVLSALLSSIHMTQAAYADIVTGGGPVHHAFGGYYAAGVPRIVGEGGQELDIPDHSGTIVPNDRLFGGGTSTVHHEGTVRIDLTPRSAQLLAQSGMPGDEVAALLRNLAIEGTRPLEVGF